MTGGARGIGKATATVLAEAGANVAIVDMDIQAAEKTAEEMNFTSWKKVIDVNQTGVFLTAQAAGKVMLKQGGGSIINTAQKDGNLPS